MFVFAGFVLVVSTYYVLNWAVQDKDTILDIHDLYYHYTFVSSWGDFSDTSSIRKELENLKIQSRIYNIKQDSLCSDDVMLSWYKEQQLIYWTNTPQTFSICDYINYQDSEHLKKLYGVEFPGHVSFGDIMIGDEIYPATVVEKDDWRVLLILDYIYPKEWLTFLPIVILSLVFMLLLYFIIWYYLQPISLMRERIKKLEGGDLDSQISVRGEDELALLAESLNVLIAQIKDLLKQKERLLSDVSHEIRTPLSKIRLILAMPPSYKEKFTKIDKQVDYLDSIVTNILISDKLSAPYSQLEIEKISVSHLLEQGIDLSKNTTISTQIDVPFDVYCDVVKISIVIKNLLDNAAKYAISKQGVLLKAYIRADIIYIECIDSGPGIEKNLLKNIAKPFIRGQNLKKSGFGLGLSICQKVVISHKGKLSVKNNANGEGACFTVSWDNSFMKEQLGNAKKQS